MPLHTMGHWAFFASMALLIGILITCLGTQRNAIYYLAVSAAVAGMAAHGAAVGLENPGFSKLVVLITLTVLITMFAVQLAGTLKMRFLPIWSSLCLEAGAVYAIFIFGNNYVG